MSDLSDASFIDAVKLQMAGENSGDRLLGVRFYTEEVEDEAASAAEGRPVFKTVEMCEIRVPGDRHNIVRGRIKNMHPDPRRRFPEAYARFKAGDAVQVKGTLLREWGMISRSRAKEYEALGTYTVEQLAGMGDANVQGIRGALAERQKARDFLDVARGQAPLSQARAEIDALRSELQALKEQMSGVSEAPKRRGRPPKVRPEGEEA